METKNWSDVDLMGGEVIRWTIGKMIRIGENRFEVEVDFVHYHETRYIFRRNKRHVIYRWTDVFRNVGAYWTSKTQDASSYPWLESELNKMSRRFEVWGPDDVDPWGVDNLG